MSHLLRSDPCSYRGIDGSAVQNETIVFINNNQARMQGGVGGVVRHPLETAGIDFYSGFRKIGQGGCKSKS